VHVGRLDGAAQIGLRRDVDDRIVNEDQVELTCQPDGAHVAFDVLALGVQPTAHGKHAR
jgi:hypothetical protein